MAALAPGCSEPATADWDARVLKVDADWVRLDPREVRSETPVPGDPLGGWMSPGGSTLIVAYKTLPAPGATAKSLATEFAQRLQNLAGVESVSANEIHQHGVGLARVEARAPGTGRSWASNSLGTATKEKGFIPTRMIALAYPRPEASYWLVAYFPEDRPGVRTNAEAVLHSWNPTRVTAY